MLRHFTIATAVVSCFAAAGWAQAPLATIPASDASKTVARLPIKRNDAALPERGPCHIGVIPIAGNLFRVEGIAVVRVATDGWGLDELVVSRVRAAAPARSVRRIPFTPEELIRDAQERPRSFFRDDDVNIKEFAQRIAGRISCERYVVVHRRGGDYREFGIGISTYLFDNKAILYAMMHVRVYDGRTFELIKQGPASIKEENFVGRLLSGPPGGPSRELDLSAFPNKPADAARSPMLRDGVRALLTASLDNTLPAMLRQ
jgi:hypothetical protein